MTVVRFLNDLEIMDTKQGTTQSLIDEARGKNARLAELMETYRVAQEKRNVEIAERETRLGACSEIRAELDVLLPRLEVLEAERGDTIWSPLNMPVEYSRWKTLVDDFNRVYYAKGDRKTTPQVWED